MQESAYLILLVLIAFIEIARKKSYRFDFLTLFHFYFALMYALSAFLLAFDYNAAGNSQLSYSNSIQTVLAIFVGYFLVVIGFYAKSAQKLANNIIIKARINNLSVFVYAVFLLLFSCLAIYVYSSQYGGVLQTIASTTARRSQAIEAEGSGGLVFFGRLTLFSVLSSYLLGSFIFIKKQQQVKSFIYITITYSMFIFSVTVAIIAITITGGRSYLLNYLLGFYLIYLIKSKRVSWLLIGIIACFGSLFLFYGKPFFFSLTALPDGYEAVIEKFYETIDADSDEVGFYNFMKNFTFPVYSLDAAFGKDYPIRWFADFIYGFLTLIPDRLLGTEPPETIVNYNSRLILGHNDFQIPVGFLAFGIYSLWWPGLIIVCWAYGWIGRYLQTILEKRLHDIYWLPCLYVVTAQMWMDSLSSDPETFLQAYFCYFTACFFLIFIGSKVTLTRNS